MNVLEESTEFDRAKAVCKKLAHQATSGNEAALIFAVFRQAVLDSFHRGKIVGEYGESRAYLRKSPNPHLEILGIDTDWARLQFKIAKTRIMQ